MLANLSLARLCLLLSVILLAPLSPRAHAQSGSGGDEAAAARERPNIVLILADDLGYGDLSCYGNPVTKTPNLDRLASQGIRMTSFYAAPACVASRARLLTGRYRIRTGAFGTGPGGSGGLNPSEITLAEALKEVGYRTAMLGKWHLGYSQEKFLPVRNGFDYWFGLPYSNDFMRPWVQTDVPLNLYRNTEVIEHPVEQDTLTTRYTEQAVRIIKEAEDESEPLFLYLAYNMPHLPLRPAERFRGTSPGGLYGDVLRTIDWSVGQVTKTLEETGQAENTIVVFLSDNGPWINPPPRMLQEGNKRWHVGMVGPLRGAKGDTYEGGVRVPCIARWPGRIPAGQESAEIATEMDIFATLAEAGGADLPDSHTLDGHDLMPLLSGETEESPTKTTYHFRGRYLQAVRDGPWKFRLVGEGPQLFHLNIDPAERYNRAEDKPQIVERLEKKLRAFGEEVGARVQGDG